MESVRLLLLLLLLPHLGCGGHGAQCTGNNPLYIPHEWYQPGDLLIGEMLSHIYYLTPDYTFTKHPSQERVKSLFSVLTKLYQHALALAFAVQEVNEDPDILPNITLGFHIYDSHLDPRMTYRTTLDILFKSDRFVPNYKCGIQNNVVGIVGGLDHDTSSLMADILSLYKIPQFSYGSFVLAKTDKSDFPTFFRMVLSEAIQYQGIVQLLLHFGWRWVGIITMDNEAGDNILQILETMLSQKGICAAFVERAIYRVPINLNESLISFFIKEMRKNMPFYLDSTANAIVMYGEIESMIWIADFVWAAETIVLPVTRPGYKLPTGKVWIITAQIDFTSNMYYKMLHIHPFRDGLFHGALSFAIHSNSPPGFIEFLQDIDPLEAKGIGFIKNFWKQAFSCSFPNQGVPSKNTESCTGEEDLESLPAPFFEMSMTGHSYSVYNAAHALAHALHLLHSSGPRYKRGVDLGRWNMEPWQLHSLLLRFSFNNICGEQIKFNEQGETEGGFDVTNLITFENDSYVRVKVGRLDPQAPLGKELVIEEDIIECMKS